MKEDRRRKVDGEARSSEPHDEINTAARINHMCNFVGEVKKPC